MSAEAAHSLSSFMLQSGLFSSVLVRCAPTFRGPPSHRQAAVFAFFDVRHLNHARDDPA